MRLRVLVPFLVALPWLFACDLSLGPDDDIAGIYAAIRIGESSLPTTLSGGGVTIHADTLRLLSSGEFSEDIFARNYQGIVEVKLTGRWHVADDAVWLRSRNGRYEHELAIGPGGLLSTKSHRHDPGLSVLWIYIFDRIK